MQGAKAAFLKTVIAKRFFLLINGLLCIGIWFSLEE